MKTSTLISIAREVERYLGIQSKCTINDMVKHVKYVAGHCRTKASVAELLLEDYGYSILEYPMMKDFVNSYKK